MPPRHNKIVGNLSLESPSQYGMIHNVDKNLYDNLRYCQTSDQDEDEEIFPFKDRYLGKDTKYHKSDDRIFPYGNLPNHYILMWVTVYWSKTSTNSR